MKKIFLLFGAPGCGKGYLGYCIQQELEMQGKVSLEKIKYVSTGDLLRAEIVSESDLGRKIQQIVASGQFVSDEIVRTLVQNALKGDEEVFFVDGYPRTVKQFEAFRNMLDWDKNQLIAIKRNTPVKIILERVSKRRVCQKCGATHSVDDGSCPKCGGPSVVRKDDSVIEKRLSEYKANTEALWPDLVAIAHDSVLVDGEREAHDVAKAIVTLAYA